MAWVGSEASEGAGEGGGSWDVKRVGHSLEGCRRGGLEMLSVGWERDGRKTRRRRRSGERKAGIMRGGGGRTSLLGKGVGRRG